MCQTVVGVAIFDVREENVVDLLFQLERLRCRIDSLVPVADSPVPDRLEQFRVLEAHISQLGGEVLEVISVGAIWPSLRSTESHNAKVNRALLLESD